MPAALPRGKSTVCPELGFLGPPISWSHDCRNRMEAPDMTGLQRAYLPPMFRRGAAYLLGEGEGGHYPCTLVWAIHAKSAETALTHRNRATTDSLASLALWARNTSQIPTERTSPIRVALAASTTPG